MMLSDSEKLECLFDLYERKMYGTAFQILRDEGQAEDAVQDAFIRVMAHIHQIRLPESVETQHFMVKVIRSAAIDIYRKNQRDRENTVFDPEDIQKNRKSFEDRNLDTVENRQMIQRALLGWIRNTERCWSLDAILGSVIKRSPFFWRFPKIRWQNGIRERSGLH